MGAVFVTEQVGAPGGVGLRVATVLQEPFRCGQVRRGVEVDRGLREHTSPFGIATLRLGGVPVQGVLG